MDMRSRLYKRLSWMAVLLWMIFIFYLSSQVAEQSDQLSKGVTEIVIQTVEKVAPKKEFDIDTFNHIVRKNAHFFAYLVLGILGINALRKSGTCGYRNVILAVLISVSYAISDELHQIFVPGRGPGVKDVLIDSAGAMVGILIFLGLSTIKKKVMSND